jgi:hypothetical protein
MGCCSPNKSDELEFINNLSHSQKKSINENYSIFLNNENLKNKNQINTPNIVINEQNFEDNSEKIKFEKDKEKENDKDDSRFSLISSSEKNNNTTTKISNSDYENFVSLYPVLTTENQDKLELKKNMVLENKSIYYGEFNKEKNIKEGRGILIWPNGAKYTGYFQNNMQNIKGTMYHIDGDIYEGEWLNNKANGEGKFIHKGIIYEGQWKNDKQNGHGKESWKDGSYYEGDFVNGKKEGKGKFVWADGSSYEGDFKDIFL